jgi:hypothetical protein
LSEKGHSPIRSAFAWFAYFAVPTAFFRFKRFLSPTVLGSGLHALVNLCVILHFRSPQAPPAWAALVAAVVFCILAGNAQAGDFYLTGNLAKMRAEASDGSSQSYRDEVPISIVPAPTLSLTKGVAGVDSPASGPNGPRMMHLSKMLDPIASALILPEVTDVSKWYGGKHWFADPENRYIFIFEGTIVTTGLSYNTKMIPPDEIKSYWDLLQPKWKGKILAQDPRGAALLTPVLILYHRAGVGSEFLRKFYSETDITLFRDRRQGTNWLASGKFPLCHLCREIDKAQQQGLPVDELPPDKLKEGGTIGTMSSSLTKR